MSKEKESSKNKSKDETSQDETSKDEASQDEASQDETKQTETTEEPMSRTVTVKKDEDAPENIFNLEESIKKDQKYHLPKSGDGLHFKTLESVKNYFERRYKGYQVKID